MHYSRFVRYAGICIGIIFIAITFYSMILFLLSNSLGNALNSGHTEQLPIQNIIALSFPIIFGTLAIICSVKKRMKVTPYFFAICSIVSIGFFVRSIGAIGIGPEFGLFLLVILSSLLTIQTWKENKQN
ncbi:hypothetical protein KHA96_20335 [Bacillus sp. FJAT-49711]|uniref:hypothetical protein n=1 Tax=Bacillus sp. FJAT-49711 TaxID=2833585 RepID=UPI001BC9FEF0|nr:hypothetical protein [Bacillus sp. FJAT-49711]MBS4220649.1 hypothetical protein [Bacillus sp. FJAT-49711]